MHTAILKRAGFEITQSSTRTATGKNKIVAALKASLFGVGAEASGEKEQTTSDAVTKHPLELDPEDVNDIISALHCPMGICAHRRRGRTARSCR